ncbi:AlbA family DNA-binding domain-containing protein [Micromonospora sp. CPCC 206061]|uniref:AlbA family DNA-binding domain-containing protein n=1 Tax=Micromonospora sp. CPCC 206061 TaxID=3122410 RepID=UPI002FF16466
MIDAVAGGILDESHWVDLKQELGKGRDKNTDLAIDLASLAIDGGLLVIGVEDRQSRAGTVCGVQLAGLADRVDHVARGRVHPPLMVRCVELEDPAKPGHGCLLIHIPPSPQAPHMIDHVYYGRGDRGNRKLGDEEVRAILSVRAQQHDDVSSQLRRLAADDPVPAQDRRNGHLYLVAQPLATRDDVMVELLTAPDFMNRMLAITNGISQNIGNNYFWPTIEVATRRSRRAEGVALTSYSGNDHIRESGMIDLLVKEDAGVSLICGRGTDVVKPDAMADPASVLQAVVVLGLTHSVLTLAGRLADHYAAYQGQWIVGVRLDRLKDVVPYEHVLSLGGDFGNPYSRDEYERVTTTTTAELVDQAPAVVERLFGPLLRGLGIDSRYLPYSTESLRKSPP